MSERFSLVITTGLRSGCVYMVLATLLSQPVNFWVTGFCLFGGMLLAGLYFKN